MDNHANDSERAQPSDDQPSPAPPATPPAAAPAPARAASANSDDAHPITSKALFLAGCAGAVLAYGAYWIREFAAIQSWYVDNGPGAAIGAVVFLLIVIAIAGWVTLDSRPRRLFGAILTGLGIPGIIMAASISNSGASDGTDSEDSDVQTASFLSLGESGGWSEFLRPVFAPFSVAREHDQRELRKRVKTAEDAFEPMSALLNTYVQQPDLKPKERIQLLATKIEEKNHAIGELKSTNEALDGEIKQKNTEIGRLESVEKSLIKQINEARGLAAGQKTEIANLKQRQLQDGGNQMFLIEIIVKLGARFSPRGQRGDEEVARLVQDFEYCFVQLGDPAMRYALSVLNHHDASFRHFAVRMLGEFKDHAADAVPRLRELAADDPDRTVRAAAQLALRAIQ